MATVQKPSQAVLDANNHLIFDCILFVAEAHDGQYRPNTELPYLEHLLGALAIAVHFGLSLELRMGVLTHDVFEDTKTEPATVEKKFGPRVVHLALACTDDKTLPWKPRKDKKLEYMRKEASMDELKVMCCDKLHNVRSIRANIARACEESVDFWEVEMKHHTFEEYRWYYSELALTFMNKRRDLVAIRLFNEFTREVETVFGPIEEYNSIKHLQ